MEWEGAMAFMSAMYNTVYEAEGAVRALRGADLQTITIVARKEAAREVFVDDLISRNSLPFANTETIHITDRLPRAFLDELPAAGQKPDWYGDWLGDEYILLIVDVAEEDLERARQILTQYGGALYGEDRDIVSSFAPEGPITAEPGTEEMDRWRRKRSA
jgi:hypothetical protein